MAGFAYDIFGNVKRATDASVWKVNYDYGELNPDGTTVNQAKNTGNIARQTISFQGLTNPFVQTYKYDSLYRLTEARETTNGQQNWLQGFGYDRFGNRTSFNHNVGGLQNGYTPSIDVNTNRFNTGQGFGYDKNGNIISDVEGNLVRQFTFNGDNKQTEVKRDGITIGKYFYDGEGKRVKKVTQTETVTFVYSGGKLVAEYSSQPPPPNPTTLYTATDPLGSPRVITNAQGAVVSRRDFMPFGEELLPEGVYRKTDNNYTYGDTIRQKFTGYQKDEETQLDYAEARYYNNKHARFTAVDPLLASGKSANPQTFNRYVYSMNRPLVLTDPTGMQAGTSAGYWAYQDSTLSNGTIERTFRRYESPLDQQMREGVFGGSLQKWTGDKFYVFGGGTALLMAKTGLIFSTNRIASETLEGILATQNSGERFSEHQLQVLSQAAEDVIQESPKYKLQESLAGMAGSGLASGITNGTNYLLRNLAFGTESGEAVFYSGGGAMKYADNFALNSGRTTIGQTPGGRVLNSITGSNVFGRPMYQTFPNVSNRLWRWGSRSFAEGASGRVTFFGGRSINPNGVWSTLENPILQQNPSVIGIQKFRVPTFSTQP